jgi:tetratricopeptide (TPR) repeat protein
MGLILCRVPLFDRLSYEFSFVLSVCSALCGLLLGAWDAREGTKQYQTNLRRVFLGATQGLGALAVISCNAFWVKNCDLLLGLTFFICLPLLSSCYATSVGICIRRIISRYRFRLLVAMAFIFLSLFSIAWDLYQQAPIFVYDHFWGYFAGSLYDEGVKIDARLIAFRGVTCLRIFLLLAFTSLWDKRATTAPIPFFLITSIVLALFMGSHLSIGRQSGFIVDRQEIRKELTKTLRSPGIIIHMPHNISDHQAKLIRRDHVFHLERLTKSLDIPLNIGSPIHSYVYLNQQQKYRLTGAAQTQFTKPWLRELHIHGVASPHPHLGHELVHVLAADFGSSLLGVSASSELFVHMGMVEGFAQAFSQPRGDQGHHSYTKALRSLNRAPDIRALMRPGAFWLYSPGRAYIVAGSFIQHLAEHYGIAKLKAVYASLNFNEVYAASVDELISEWQQKIDALTLLPRDIREARSTFNRPSIFKRPCPHVIANLRKEAAGAVPNEAIDIHRRICDHLGNTAAAQYNVAQVLFRHHRYGEFRPLGETLLEKGSLGPASEQQLYSQLGQLRWSNGDLQEAKEMFQKALTLKTDLHSERLQWVRLWALDQNALIRTPIKTFLQGSMPRAKAIKMLKELISHNPQSPTLNYLLGRQLSQTKAWPEARAALAYTHSFDAIEAERYRLLAEISISTKNWTKARQDYQHYILKAPISGEQERARYKIQWIDFLERRPEFALPSPTF